MLFGSVKNFPLAFPLPELWREGMVQHRGAALASLVPELPADVLL